MKVARTTIQAAISHASTTVRVDQAIADITLDQVDAIVVVGGMGAVTYLMKDERLRNLHITASRSNKVVSAICIAPAVLGQAGVLRNREVNCFSAKTIMNILKLNGATYLDKDIVVSERIVSENGPKAAKSSRSKYLSK